MKRIIILIFIILISPSAIVMASCQYDFMSHYDIVDSRSFSLHEDDFRSDFESKESEFAKEAVLALLNEVKSCKESLQKKSDDLIGDVGCAQMIPGKAYSKNCMVESKLGYFFISMDMLGNVNIIFNRWD